MKYLRIPVFLMLSTALAGAPESLAQDLPPKSWKKMPGTPRFLTEARSGDIDYQPVFSPDGKSLVFSRTLDNSKGELFVVSAAGGEPQRLLRDPVPVDQTRPNWSAYGKIAFTGCTPKAQRGMSCGVWIVDGDGANVHSITIKGASDGIYYPSWYPDGRHLALLDADDLIILRLDTVTGTAKAVTDRSNVFTGMPAVSPDGNWIAFAGQRNEGQHYDEKKNSIWLSDENGNVNSLEPTTLQGRAPSWSPDGNHVAFQSDRNSPGHYAIFVAKRDGTNLVEVTDSCLNAQHPSWSPDGRQIAFSYQSPSDPNAWGVAIIDYQKDQ